MADKKPSNRGRIKEIGTGIGVGVGLLDVFAENINQNQDSRSLLVGKMKGQGPADVKNFVLRGSDGVKLFCSLIGQLILLSKKQFDNVFCNFFKNIPCHFTYTITQFTERIFHKSFFRVFNQIYSFPISRLQQRKFFCTEATVFN